MSNKKKLSHEDAIADVREFVGFINASWPDVPQGARYFLVDRANPDESRWISTPIASVTNKRVEPTPATATDERVLCIPTAAFHALGRFDGFSRDAGRYLDALLAPGFASFRPRTEVESDASYKQIVSYVLLRHKDSLFVYTRGKSGGEGRLHRKLSLGIGGHVSETDVSGEINLSTYKSAMYRELSEEVEIQGQHSFRVIGLINDDTDSVGQVHLGVVHRVTLDYPTVTPREACIADAGFIPIADVIRDRERFENWSQIVIDAKAWEQQEPIR
jgi:predicted NUDIX family phosphoesterase